MTFKTESSGSVRNAAATENGQNSLTVADAINLTGWVSAADRAKVSVSDMDALMKLQLSDSMGDWQRVSSAFAVAAASQDQAASNEKIEEQTSAALSDWYLKNCVPEGVSVVTRDELYEYLLIDNQVCAKVMTSSIAEAIASIQLYVDRCLHGLEEGVDRQKIANSEFFQNWDSINKRYAQWAAEQQLDFYPENYVDPAMRAHQSSLQQQLAQDLSNGQGSSEDSAETAFLNYLTGFENLANMDVLSGYHDGQTLDEGYTYFVGNSRSSPQDYYWRRLDQREQDGKGGYFAHAWSEWEKLAVPVSAAYRNEIRLVSCHDRVYIVWIEMGEVNNPDYVPGSSNDGENQQSTPVWSLNFSWENINGSWLAPVKVDLEAQPGLTKEKLDILLKKDSCRLYFTYHSGRDQLLVILYDINEASIDSTIPNDSCSALWVSLVLDIDPIEEETEKASVISALIYDLVAPKEFSGTFTHAMRSHSSYELAFKEVLTPIAPVGGVEISRLEFNTHYDAQSNRFRLNEVASVTNMIYKSPLNVGFDENIHPAYQGAPYCDDRWIDLGNETCSKTFYFYILNNDFSPISKSQYDIVIYEKEMGREEEPVYYFAADKANGLIYLRRTDDEGVKIQLSTGFAPKLIKCMASGVDQLLTLTTQQMSANDGVDFNGAYGLYYWELFYYSPLLQADRLLSQCQFDAAERWQNYIFNPQGYTDNGQHTSRTWNVLPLLTPAPLNDIEHIDPDLISQNDPFHYRVHVLMRRLDLLLARGDGLYHMLERDTLVEAKQNYLTALNVLGAEPDIALVSTWSNPTLAQAADPAQDKFQPSLNDKLAGYWQTFQNRLFNLRHNLTLEGQPMHLALYAPPADPMALYRTIGSAVGAMSAGTTAAPATPLYRYSQMAASAKELAAQLSQYGSQLLATMQQQDAEAFNVMAQQQAFDLMQYSINVQNELINQATSQRNWLDKNEATIIARQQTYQSWINEGANGVSATEVAAISLRFLAGESRTASSTMMTGGFAADLAPNIFGLAVGGTKYSAAFKIIAGVTEATAGTLDTSAAAMETSENYRRRYQQWQLMLDEANNQLEEIKEQQTAADAAQKAAENQLKYLQAQKDNFKAQLDFISKKFTNKALYDWLKGQLSSIYSQVYQLAFSRCKMAEACFNWETKLNQVFVQNYAWNNANEGLLCGERLMSYLLQMDAAYLDWDARALEITRTVSLAKEMKSLLGPVSFAGHVASILDGGDALPLTDGLSIGKDDTSLTATINLAALKLSDDYPAGLGPARRIKQVSVSLPALIGPYQDVQAVLSYDGVSKLHTSCKQIAISHGVDDAGLFQLNFQDAKYLPFEGIPIDDQGNLELNFPNATGKQAELVRSLNDIILHIRYTIRE